MAEVVEQTHIKTPPDRVWRVLAELDGISSWAPNVDHSCFTTDHTGGAGAVRRVQVGRNALLERVTEWDPGHRLAYAVDGLPPVVRSATNTWELVESGDGTTVSLTTCVDAGPRPPQQLIAWMIGRVMAKASREMLGGLEQHLHHEHEHGERVS